MALRREAKIASSTSNVKSRCRKFEIGWLHFSEEKGKYLAVRQSTGGGTRSVSLPGISGTSDIIDEARNLFFPQGESAFGRWLEMDYDLANFSGEKIDKLTTPEGKEIEFSLQSYFNLYKLTRVRLYLKTKRKESLSEKNKVGEPYTRVGNSRLLGSSQERAQLKETQDEKYEESLCIDRTKKKQKEVAFMEEIRRARNVEEIPAARLGRVLEEPGIDEPQVVVRVRHIDMGMVKRAFKPYQAMAAVYDWIGSLQLFPVYFSLCSAPGDVLDPSLLAEDAEGKVLFMEPRDYPIPLCDDDVEITFKGFGQHGNIEPALDDSLFAIGEIGTKPPLNLLAEESDSEEDGCPNNGIAPRREKKKMKYSVTSTTTSTSSLAADRGRHFRQNYLAQLPLEQTEGRHEKQELEWNSQTNTQVVMPTADVPTADVPAADVPTDDIVVVGDNSSGEEQQSNSESHCKIVKIRRVQVMKDMISLFKDKAVVDTNLNVVMINSFGKEEEGLDNSGVFLDALSAFWNSFYDSCTNGEDERVPAIRHDFQVAEWEAIARIIIKGYQQVGFFPIKLGKAFTTACLFGEEAVKEDLLLESFQAYLSSDERELVNLALNGKLDEEQENEWLDLLERFDCKTVPKVKQVKDVVLEIAHKEFIQSPRYFVDSWSTPLSALHRECPSPDCLLEMFARGKPTNKKIISLFDASPETRAQEEAMSYLKRFVRGMEDEKLTKFPRFCTGSNMVCVEKITINFNNLEGTERRPVAHTCGAVLDLPATYPSYPLFREEWNSILSSEYWDIDFV